MGDGTETETIKRVKHHLAGSPVGSTHQGAVHQPLRGEKLRGPATGTKKNKCGKSSHELRINLRLSNSFSVSRAGKRTDAFKVLKQLEPGRDHRRGRPPGRPGGPGATASASVTFRRHNATAATHKAMLLKPVEPMERTTPGLRCENLPPSLLVKRRELDAGGNATGRPCHTRSID